MRAPPLDVIAFGATSFVGQILCRYLLEEFGTHQELKWAAAGRSKGKLEELRASLGPEAATLPLVVADAADDAALRKLCASTRVMVSTVGPYALHGEPLVRACAESGTDYCDLTGEPEFVDRTWLDHHEEAVRTGARLVHCCGFDSIPHDLGAYFTVQQLPEGVPLTVTGYVHAHAQFSGGTFHSAVNGFGRARETIGAAKARRRAEQRDPARKIHAASPRIRRIPEVGGWTAPLPTIDGSVIRRSAAAVPRYGPDFTYGHNLVAKHLATIPAMTAGVGAVALLAPLPPARKLLLTLKDPGEGPDEATRARSWFKLTFVGEGGGRRVVTEVSGGDPGYTETSKMLAESALCLAFDDLPETAGQLTTVAAMGDMLLTRVRDAGISFRVR